jgi:rare lipoprotein A (peptidoglycan hydrolase)
VLTSLVLLGTMYARSLVGHTMANGKLYSPAAFTVACNRLRLGTKVIVCSKKSWKCHRAVVTDRMRDDARLDMSEALTSAIGSNGYGRVIVYFDDPKSIRPILDKEKR